MNEQDIIIDEKENLIFEEFNPKVEESNIEFTKIDIQYHGMQNILFLNDKNLDYMKWYSEDQTALGFQFCRGDLKDIVCFL